MKIKDIEFNHIAFLAPMAGVADRAFRELCVQYGASYTVTEMVSSKGLTMGDRKSGELLTIGSERPCGAQIFGDEPEVMAKAAVKCLEYSPDIIDINMGCPAPKVAMNGGGASLMKSPALAYEITKAVCEAVDIPVTVKIRKGWDDENVNAVEMACLAEKAGAAAVA
ncbi:MAG: tRNA-dihydrouridine synthase family protein, partial [Eubacterium sp.]|nr:tRNA-dihydrouridine synthase family protein [Eubacterium sp.]